MTDLAALFAEADAAMDAPNPTPVPAPSPDRSQRVPFAHDAALAVPTAPAFIRPHGTLQNALMLWRAQIASEQLRDFTCVIPSIRMDARDGALTRDAGAGLSYTARGWATLLGVTLQSNKRAGKTVHKEANTANVTRLMLDPDARALAWDGFKRRSVRDTKAPIVLRTFIDSATGTRAVRAAVTPRHALAAYDDSTLCAALESKLPAHSKASFRRGHDFTTGSVVLPDSTPTGCGFISSAIHFSNSETGCASLAFTGGAYLTVVDSEVRFENQMVERETTVQVAVEDAATMRRHTAPARLGDEEKVKVAQTRLEEDLSTVIAACKKLPAMWEAALTRYAPGSNGPLANNEVGFEILLDSIEENTSGFVGSDRATLKAVLVAEERLGRIPTGSAAHVAAAYAVAAREEKNIDEAHRLQGIAGQWISKGWVR